MTTRRILLRITSISLLMALLAVGGLLAQPTPPPIIVSNNTTTTFTFDDGVDPSVWFSGTYAIAPQADGGNGMTIALDDAPVTLNRPLLDGETLAVTLRRGVGRAGVRLVGETAAYTVWIETSGIAVLERDGAEQGRVPVAGDAQRVTLTYASGTLTASVGAYAFPPISDGTAFASLRAEFVVQGGNGQGSTFDDVTVPLPPGLVMNTTTPSDSIPQLLDNVDPAASLTVHYEQDFEDPVDPLIGLVGSDARALVHTGDSYALLLNEGVYQVTGQVYDAIAIETEFALTTASLSLAVRDSGSGGYRAQISADGSVSLSRDGTVVQSALITLSSELTPMRLTAIGAEITVTVGTQTVLTWEDSEPLPLGSVIVTGTTAGTGAVIVDNLRLLSSPQTGALASAQSQSISGQAVYDVLMQLDERLIVSSGDGYALYQQGMAYPLTMPAELVAGVPKLSPDEQWLAFACRFPATDGAGICIARPNAIAATLQVLFQVFPDGMPPFQITTTFWDVYWSPDSERLVFYEVTTTPVRSGEPDVGQQVGQIVIDTVAGTSIGNPTAIPDSSRCQGEIAWIDAERFTCYGHVHVTAGAYSIEPGIYAFDLTTDQVSLVTPVPPADLNTPVGVNRCWPMSARAATDHHWFTCWTRTQILGQQSAFSYLRAFDILPPTAAITTVYTDTRWGFSPNWTYLSPDGATLWWTEGGANGVPTTYHPMTWNNGTWTPGSVIITTEATRIYQWETCLTPDCALPSTLLLDVSLAPQVNPAALQVGDRIPVVVRVTNTGSTAVQANSTLSLTIPTGLTPAALSEATATLDLLTLLQNLIDSLIAWFGGAHSDYPFTFTRQPDAIDMQVDYPIPPLGPFETEVFEITLEVRPEYAGIFTLSGTVTTELPEAAPLELMTTQILSSTTSESNASANLVLQVNPLISLSDCASLAEDTIIQRLASAFRFIIAQSDLIDEGEVRASCRAVVNTANALLTFAESVPGGPTYESSAETFVNILLGSPEASITYSNLENTPANAELVGPYNCKSGLTTIVCGALNMMSEYTMTHELGHVFLERTETVLPNLEYPCPVSESSTPSFNDCMEVPVFEDGNEASLGTIDSFVFGYRGFRLVREQVTAQLNRLGITDVNAEQFGPYQDILPGSQPAQPGDLRTTSSLLDWLRGTRGWGSGAPEIGSCGSASQIVPTDFQQNPCEYITWLALISQQYRDRFGGDQNPTVTEIVEAGADMFLNWVYRSITQDDSTDTDYQGFLNVDWADCIDASECADAIAALPYSDGPGDDRWIWMNTRMAEFFVYYGW